MRSQSIFRAFVVSSVAALALGFGVVPAAQADPICASASTAGVGGSRQVGPVCVPYSGPVLCHWERVTVGSLLIVQVNACHPW